MATGTRPGAAQEHREGGAAQGTRIAAIDIGSNSIRQIVADVSSDGSIRIADELRTSPRLAAGLHDTGTLSNDAMERAIESLTRMSLLARQLGAERVVAVATSAVREAANADEFIRRVKRASGLDVRVLDGTEEARLSFRSALAHFDLAVGRFIVIDIGGGSMELAMSADGVVERLTSLPLGAIRLTETFFAQKTSTKGLRKLRRHVREAIREEIRVRDWRGAKVIGSGGTFTNLAAMHLHRLGIGDAPNVHGTPVERVELKLLLESLVEMTPEERAGFPGLNPSRSDIISAGLAVAAEVMDRVDARQVVVSRYGIREGLLLETARVKPVFADPGEARQRSILELAQRCQYEPMHAKHVQTLALSLFDSMGERLGLSAEDRQVLADAALLHDVGYHISFDKHHRHTYHLVAHAELLGVTPAEQLMIANVARYHRGKRPKKRHENFGSLDPEIRERIVKLAALLRLADGLDRGHCSGVGGVKVRWLDRAVRIAPEPRNRTQPMRLELWGAQKKSRLLARIAGRPVEVVSPRGEVLSSEELEV
jgi:exopolyphosphatase / guanosine-5'-triphosphate,3'-diphosphate pyrophosphatase